MLTNEQVFALGQFYKDLSVAMRGERGAKDAELQNAAMRPLKGITLMITVLHQAHKVTPSLDREIGSYLNDISLDDMDDFEKVISTSLQGSFLLGYTKGGAKVNPHGIGIKAARKKSGMTEKELSEKIGVSLRQVQRWESGDQLPPLPVAQKVADLLGCSVNELF